MMVKGVDTNIYPPLLYRSAAVLRIFHAAAQVLVLRNWYVRKRLRRLVDSLPQGAVVVDIGCGAGDHVFYALRCRPDLNVIGIDRSEASIELCRTYAEAVNVRAEFICVDVDHHVDLPSADLLLCITALQYVADDNGLLRRMRGILRAGGRLLVYVPVRNRRITSLYRRIVEENPAHYDMAYGRRRIYRARDAIATLEASGFSIQRSQQAYGIFGRLYFETFELLLYGMSRRAWRLLHVPLAVILSPALIFLMMLDFAFPIQRGNGLLLEAM